MNEIDPVKIEGLHRENDPLNVLEQIITLHEQHDINEFHLEGKGIMDPLNEPIINSHISNYIITNSPLVVLCRSRLYGLSYITRIEETENVSSVIHYVKVSNGYLVNIFNETPQKRL